MSLYEKHTHPDARLPFIFHTFQSLPSLSESGSNWHENVEILFFKRGTGLVRINEREHAVAPGDILVVNANRIHSIKSTTELLYCCLIVDRAFCLANYLDTNLITFEEYIRDDGLFALLCDIMDARQADDDYAIQHLRAEVLRAMVWLCRHHSHSEASPSNDTRLLACIKQAIGYLHSEMASPLSLADIAGRVGLSKYYFEKCFKSVTGYTPISYLNHIRCDRAQRLLLNTDKSIGEICAECGFADQSYFTKVFKKTTGALPTALRRAE